MMPGGVTELVWHFFGHLRIDHDIARDRIAYEDPALPSRPDDYKTQRPDFGKCRRTFSCSARVFDFAPSSSHRFQDFPLHHSSRIRKLPIA